MNNINIFDLASGASVPVKQESAVLAVDQDPAGPKPFKNTLEEELTGIETDNDLNSQEADSPDQTQTPFDEIDPGSVEYPKLGQPQDQEIVQDGNVTQTQQEVVEVIRSFVLSYMPCAEVKVNPANLAQDSLATGETVNGNNGQLDDLVDKLALGKQNKETKVATEESINTDDSEETLDVFVDDLKQIEQNTNQQDKTKLQGNKADNRRSALESQDVTLEGTSLKDMIEDKPQVDNGASSGTNSQIKTQNAASELQVKLGQDKSNHESATQQEKHNQELNFNIAKNLEVKNTDPSAALSKPEAAYSNNPRVLDIKQFASDVAIQVSKGNSEVKISLKPENLGEVLVRVKFDGDSISLVLKADNLQARQLLEANIDQLKTALEEHGIKMTDFNVNTNSGWDNDTGKDALHSRRQQAQLASQLGGLGRPEDIQQENSDDINTTALQRGYGINILA